MVSFLVPCSSYTTHHFIGAVAKPPPDLTYHISTMRVPVVQPNKYLTNSSLLTLITLNSAFKHISVTLIFIKSEKLNGTKENFKILRKKKKKKKFNHTEHTIGERI